MSKKYFGTDGIRGKVGEHPITADFMLKLGWAAGQVLTRHAQGKKRVLIGKDTRVSGYMFESALEAGLIAAGVDVDMLGPMPTPASPVHHAVRSDNRILLPRPQKRRDAQDAHPDRQQAIKAGDIRQHSREFLHVRRKR